MIWHEFLRRFKPKAITTLWVFGPILIYQLFGRALEYLGTPPLGIRKVLMAAIAVLVVLALACWIWVVGEWAWFWSRGIRIFSRKFCRFLRERLKKLAAQFKWEYHRVSRGYTRIDHRISKRRDKDQGEFKEKSWKEGEQRGQQLKRDKPFDPWAESGRDVTVWEPGAEDWVRLDDPRGRIGQYPDHTLERTRNGRAVLQ
jgi:hypothetical protein